MKGKYQLYICIVGVYNPLTAEGKILVDSILTSSYASFPDHDVAHFIMAPMRWIPEIMHWIFGEDNESPVYDKINEYFWQKYVSQYDTLGHKHW